MKYLAHVPTEQYGYISVEVEGEPKDAVLAYNELKRAFEGGMDTRAFAQILHEYCNTGAIVNGGNYGFSASQKLLLGEVRRLTRNLKNK